jgi:ferredoxin
MAKVTIKVNKEKCIGCGSCFATAPEIFAIDIDGKAKVTLTETEDQVLIDKAKMAMDMCPNGAIEVIES